MEDARIVSLLSGMAITSMLTNGYTITVHNGEEEVLANGKECHAIQKAMRSRPRDMLLVYQAQKMVGWIMFDYERHPTEMLADSTENLSALLVETRAMAARIAQAMSQEATR